MSRRQRRAAAKLSRSDGLAAATTPIGSAVAELLTTGLQHHQAGRLGEAEACYRRVLTVQPKHPDALHLRGVIAHQLKRYELAVQLISEAIERNQQSPYYFS